MMFRSPRSIVRVVAVSILHLIHTRHSSSSDQISQCCRKDFRDCNDALELKRSFEKADSLLREAGRAQELRTTSR